MRPRLLTGTAPFEHLVGMPNLLMLHHRRSEMTQVEVETGRVEHRILSTPPPTCCYYLRMLSKTERPWIADLAGCLLTAAFLTLSTPHAFAALAPQSQPLVLPGKTVKPGVAPSPVLPSVKVELAKTESHAPAIGDEILHELESLRQARPSRTGPASLASERLLRQSGGLGGLKSPSQPALLSHEKPGALKRLPSFDAPHFEFSEASDTPLIFDIPVTYNTRVKHWLKFFQTTGRNSFRKWLERSGRYRPFILNELETAGLPLDLLYIPMIESGFSSHAVSHAAAVGMWQFIEPTGRRYGLKVNWWLDERRDVTKATKAAIGYIQDLHKMFGSWYLVAASYNMGENGVRRLIKKHGTNNFWALADKGALSEETKNYVPKILAAMLIAKAPALYGFRDLQYHMPLKYEYFTAPGGTDLINLANYLGVSENYLKDLNPELIKGFIPKEVASHRIRIPKGSIVMVSQFVRMQTGDEVTDTLIR